MPRRSAVAIIATTERRATQIPTLNLNVDLLCFTRLCTDLPMQSSVAWKNGLWVKFADAQLALDDWGVVQGVVIVDRLRTCLQRVVDLELHMERLIANCQAIGIDSKQLECVPEIVAECAHRNQKHFEDQDLGIVVLVTPGGCRQFGPPTLIIHAQHLNWSTLAHWHSQGQELIVATCRNVPAACWSPHLKTRARLHYYLADREAVTQAGQFAGAVLLNIDGDITETSAASLVIVDDQGRLCCPPKNDVLGSISLIRTLRLAKSAGLQVVRQPISVSQIESARELLLTGTSGCLWPAASFADRKFTNSTEAPVYVELRDRWIAEIGLDYVAQAKLLNHRGPGSAL